MDAIVECACCHRQERWSTEGDRRSEVLMEGGSRRPPGNPAKGRAETAIRLAEDPARRVVGDCPACGQLLVSGEEALPAVPVDVDTPLGALHVADGAITGPAGPLDRDAALDLCRRAWRAEELQVQKDAAMRAPLVLSMFVLLGAWILAIGFVWIFLASLLQGAGESASF